MPAFTAMAADLSSSLNLLDQTITRSKKTALREVGAEARRAHMAHASEVPGSDRKFSGTDKYNGGRLGVKVRYEDAEDVVRVAPAGPWGLAEGDKGRKPDGQGSWTAGWRDTAQVADQVIPKTIDAEVQAAWRRG